MADFDWNNRCVNPDLMHFEIMDTLFYFSLWECNNPVNTFCYGDYFIKVDAHYNGYGKKFLKNRKFYIGNLPANDVTNESFKKELKALIEKFFGEHLEFVRTYNLYHNVEGKSYDSIY